MQSYSLDSLNEKGFGLRVVFEQQADRYAHRLVIVSPSGDEPAAISIEGSDQQNWPSSPPLQQFCLEDRRQSETVLMGVGMAGRSHWSLSCERGAEDCSLVFDIACRCSAQPERLGAAFKLHGDYQMVIADHNRAMVRIPAEPGHVLVFEVVNNGKWSQDENELHLDALPGEVSCGQTVSWQYQMKLEQAGR